MDFRQLTECFEGTIFADDYRTNLKSAKERIVALEICESTNQQGNDRSGLVLAQAVYSSICGDFASANGYLAQLSSIAQSTNDNSLCARCIIYEVYIRCTQKAPPLLRFRVDSGTGPAVARGIEISALLVRFIRKRSERGSQELSPLEKFEVAVLHTCSSFLDELWFQAFPEHPRYFKDHSTVLFQKDRNYWDDIRQSGGDNNFPAIGSYFDKLTLRYQLAGDGSNARSSLLNLYEDVLERGDLIASANFQLQLGDAILSPPFTSPLALNLISVISDVGWDNDIWDKKEQGFPLKQDVEAMQCYLRAHSLFEAGDSGRGMAAVLLRYACLDIAKAILEPTYKDAKTEKDLVQSAYDHLAAAKKLFEGDITSSLIVNGHLAICQIIRNDFSEALKLCFEIGDAGRRAGNICTSEFVGMLHLRLARRLSLDEARLNHVPVFCACATVCFKGLNDPYLELHAVAASARFHQQRGDIPVAMKHVKNGRKLLDLAAAYFDGLKAQVESLRSSYEDQEQTQLDNDLNMLKGKRNLCIMNFDRLASAIDNSKQDTQNTQNTQNRSLTQKVSSSSPSQLSRLLNASPFAAMLQSFQFDGLDPSLMANLQLLVAESTIIEDLRQQYQDAIQRRRDELVINSDIDAAERQLTDFLEKLEKTTIFSEELETMKTAAFQYLGNFDRARDTITRILPKSFGGTRGALPEPEGVSEQFNDVMATAERQRFDRAVSLCFVAKDWKRGMSGVQHMLQRDPTSLDDMKSSDDPHIWYNMVWIACILEQNGDLGRALEWYLNAFHVVEAHRQQLADIKDRRDILSTVSSGELFLGMARIAFQFSDTADGPCGPTQEWTLTSAEWKDQGLRFLELGRSRTLLDLLLVKELAPRDLKGFKEWSEYSHSLRLKETRSSTEHTTETEPQDLADNEPGKTEKYLKQIYDELMTDLNSQSLSKLLPEPAAVRESNEKLYQCIPETAIVLHISSGREGLMILCITSQGIIHTHTAETTDLQFDRHIFRLAKLFRDVKNPEPSRLPAIATCEQHLQAISDVLIEPVAQHIKTKDHVIFIPSPSLNKFPLCALIYNKEPLFLNRDVSQVPSLSVLQYMVNKKHHVNKGVNVIYKDPGRIRDGALDLSTSAAIQIAGSFQATPQAATGTFTQDGFFKVYEQSDVLLLATHGMQSTKSAWESSLLLHPPFRVLDLAKMHSNASLIIFEACVSGLGEESIGNDLLGFSHAVLASGATSFLGGLWKVSDETSALLMLFLFEEFKTDKGKKSLARCWRNAQTKLYELDAAGAAAIFEDVRKHCAEAFKANLIDRALATRLRWTLQIVIRDLQQSETNFKHPFYWAPFVLMGHAGLVLDFT